MVMTTRYSEELPPRTRRIQIEGSTQVELDGTTSAHAENTTSLAGISPTGGNYLRARGEYCKGYRVGS